MGHIGPCCYYIILELCSEKLIKNHDKCLEKDDLLFGFSSRFLRQNLRISSAKLEQFLNKCSTLGLLSYKKVENNFEIFMPILLDLLDSDFKKTRSRRVDDASKTPLDIEKEIEKEIDKNKELDILCFDIFEFWNKYDSLTSLKALTPKRKIKIKARLKQFSIDQIKQAISSIPQSEFLSGRKTEWKATFDWVFERTDNLQKIIEGNYINKPTKAQSVFDHARDQIDRINRGEL